MTPDALAALHRLCFTDTPRPWSAEEFRELLELPSTLFAVRPGGFALGRLAGLEAEVLTLAVHPAARRRGLGAALVERRRGAGGGARRRGGAARGGGDERGRARALCCARLRAGFSFYLFMPRPWSAEAFRALLALGSTLFAARPGGFAVGRLAGPEAELLTLAVHPAARRRGLGAALVRDIEAQAAARGAEEARLEVARDQRGRARALCRARLAQVGRRPGYYAPAGRPPVDALVLFKRLAPARPRGLHLRSGSGTHRRGTR